MQFSWMNTGSKQEKIGRLNWIVIKETEVKKKKNTKHVVLGKWKWK